MTGCPRQKRGGPNALGGSGTGKLENSHRARVVHCIDQAKEDIGKDSYVGKARKSLANAIWLSCMDGSQYNFEAFGGLIPVSGRCFIDTKLVFKRYQGAAGAVKCGQSEWNIWGRLSRDGQVKRKQPDILTRRRLREAKWRCSGTEALLGGRC